MIGDKEVDTGQAPDEEKKVKVKKLLEAMDAKRKTADTNPAEEQPQGTQVASGGMAQLPEPGQEPQQPMAPMAPPPELATSSPVPPAALPPQQPAPQQPAPSKRRLVIRRQA